MTRLTTITLAASVLLAGCGEVVTDTACASFQPIRYSASQDRPETVTQIRQHNAAWAALCERKRLR